LRKIAIPLPWWFSPLKKENASGEVGIASMPSGI